MTSSSFSHPLRAALAAADMLSSLPEAALEELAAAAKVSRFQAGDTIFDEGEDGSTLHVVRSGVLKVIRKS